MADVRDFLVELGTEELPPKALKSLLKSFAGTLQQELESAGLAFDKKACEFFAAPRRLSARIVGLVEKQADRVIEKQGPFVAQAYKDNGEPTPAAAGFAKSNGVELADLIKVDTDKGERLVFRANEPGKLAVELLPAMVEKALNELPIPKRMRWGASRAEFVRPVHWLVMLYGNDVVEAEILGLQAGRESRGHRFHAPEAFAIDSPASYQAQLRERYVEACFKLRRDKITAQVNAVAEQLGGKAVIERDLLDEVTALVEWPVALAGKFEERFLSVPQEALISSMSEHQKYFHVVDSKGKLLPHFITVANIESKNPQAIVDGNERVIRPRLSDAAFFYTTDLKTQLIDNQARLKTIVFQASLGTLFDKTERVTALAEAIAGKLGNDPALAARAAQLAKCDLVSNMVNEFDTMQGIAGRYYALANGEQPEVAEAIAEQYLPRFAGDEVPATGAGIALALADRLDSIVGIIGIGQIPTGSKDPFALRRASIGVLNIILKRGLDLDLAELVAQSVAAFGDKLTNKDVQANVLDYMLERLRGIYADEAIATETFNAVQAKQLTRPLDIHARIQAVQHFVSLDEAVALAAANKRVSNILTKAGEVAGEVDAALLQEAAEQELAAQVAAKAAAVAPLYAAGNYTEVLASLASLRAPVDAFFDGVMVMADDEALKNNRLCLLAQLQSLFLQVADISQLVAEKK